MSASIATAQDSPLKIMVRPAGFEPTAPGLGILCSILLSYGRALRPLIPWRRRGCSREWRGHGGDAEGRIDGGVTDAHNEA